MYRRTFVLTALPLGLAGMALAQNKKPDRLSGAVRSIDKATTTIQMTMRAASTAVRSVMYDPSTKFTLNGKPATADDVKSGQRIVALGKFEGVKLKAATVTLTLR